MLDPVKSVELPAGLFGRGKGELKHFLTASLANEEIGREADAEPGDGAAPEAEEEMQPPPIRRRRLLGGTVRPENVLEMQITELIWVLENGEFQEGAAGVQFWLQNENRFSRIALLALQMLAIPATSAPVERMFSQAGLSAIGQRTRIAPVLLEAEVLMKYNRKIFIV